MALFGRPTPQDEQKAQAYAAWVQQRNPFAIASMVLGVFSLIEFGVLLVFGIGGIILGIIALRRLAEEGRDDMKAKPRGHPLASGGGAAGTRTPVCASGGFWLCGGGGW